MYNIKKLLYLYVIVIAIVFIIACGGSNEVEVEQGDPVIEDSTIKNDTPVGLSSFAIGLSKFPIEDYKKVSKLVKKVATNELFIFPEEEGNGKERNVFQIENLINELVSGGYYVFHEIHVFNGPGLRKSTDRWSNAVTGRKINDKEFERLLNSDSTFRSAIKNKLRQVVDHAKNLQSIGAEVVISPELECNISNASFLTYIEFLNQLGWSNSNIVKNCMGGSRLPGIRYEVHPRSLAELQRKNLQTGDIWNNDGVDVAQISNAEIKKMINYANKKGIISYIWYSKLQGLKWVGPDPTAMVAIGEHRNRKYTLNDLIGATEILSSLGEVSTTIGIGTDTPFTFSKFLWKPKAESSYNPGGLIIHNDSCNAKAIVNGVELKDYGPGNGRCGTYRHAKTGCAWGNNVKVEIFDILTGKPYYAEDKPYIIIPNGCSRVERYN